MQKMMVFIDSRVNDLDLLISQFEAGTEYRVLDATHDGLLQISQSLVGKSDYSSIQIISHGSFGAITIGSTVLDSSTLDFYAAELALLGNALTDTGDLLLYGCNVAAGDQGHYFIETLSQMTGADVAASDDLTGGTAAGGDWVLEAQTGVVEAAGMFDESLASFAGVLAAPVIFQPVIGISFSAKVDYATGSSPYSVISTDINGDDKADLVVANSGSNTVSVLLNKGDGTFLSKVDYATGSRPYSVISTDINGDTKADLVVVNGGRNTISVLKKNGDGTFATKVDYATGLNPFSVISADINGDSKADLIVTNQGSNTLSVLINNGDGIFADKVDYLTGNTPGSIASADVDGDSKVDLIVANYNSNSLSVLKKNGDGTFASKVDYATGIRPVSVISADVDGDGKADLIVANSGSNTVSVLKNNSDGTFAPKIDYITGSLPYFVTTSDINRDGKVDLIVANLGSNTVSVLKNNGDGIFAAKVDYSTGISPRSVTSIDVNSDGKADLVVANSNSKTLSVLTNIGEPAATSFTEQTPTRVSAALTLSDPDGDTSWNGGSLRVQITANAEAADQLSLATLNPGGNGIWLDRASNKLMAGITEIGTVAAPFVNNGDAWLLHFNANATNALVQEVARSVTYNNSSDTPGTAVRTISVTAMDNSGASASIVQSVTVTPVNDLPTLTLFNGAVAATNDYGEVDITFSELQSHGDEADADGSVTAFVVKSVSTGTLRIGLDALTASAYNATTNNTIDATNHAYWTPALTAHSAVLNAFMAVARDNSGAESSTAIQATVSVTAPILTSFTGAVETTNEESTVEITLTELKAHGDEAVAEGTIDAFVIKDLSSGSLKIGSSSESATPFAWRTNNTIDATHHAYWTPATNANGTLNAFMAVAMDNSGTESRTAIQATVSVIPVNDAPIISPSHGYSLGAKVDYATGSAPKSLISADITGDGKADLLVVNAGSNTVSVFKNSGDGTFTARVDYATGSSPQSVTSADIDGDGKADLIVANSGSNTVSVLKNNGDGIFAPKVDYATGTTPRSITTADIDGDGKLDLLVANYGSNTLTLLKNNGDGTFASKFDYSMGTSPSLPYSLTSADVNGDGKTDLIVCVESTSAYYSNRISVLTNNGDGNFARADYIISDGKYWYLVDFNLFVTTADVNGDGKVDLIVAHELLQSYTTTLTVLINNGDGTFQRASYATDSTPQSVTTADLNGDSKVDLIVANGTTLSVMTNNGDGTFAPKSDYVMALENGTNSYSVATADLNSDGTADLIVANEGNNTLSVVTNSVQTSAIATHFTPKTPVKVCSSIIINDPDGDASWNGGELTIAITAHAEAADSLKLATTNPGGSGIWLDTTGNKLMAGTIQIGVADAPFVNNGDLWSFSFNDYATNALVQEVARSVSFTNSSDTPANATRDISFTVIDNGSDSAYMVQNVTNVSTFSAGGGKIISTGGYGYNVIMQSDGKILVAGLTPLIGAKRWGQIVRYNIDGSLDTTFSGDGVFNLLDVIDDGIGWAWDNFSNSVATQADGKIVFAGNWGGGGILVRFQADGSIHEVLNGFSSNSGGVETPSYYNSSLTIQSDGKILVAGQSKAYGSLNDFVLMRYNPDGRLDTSFSGDGVVTTDFFGQEDIPTTVALQSDGKIVVAGRSSDSNHSLSYFTLARYDTDGNLDTSFSGDGKVTTDLGGSNDALYSMAVQSDGKILVVGQHYFDDSVGNQVTCLALLRYNADGSPDTSFSNDGKVILMRFLLTEWHSCNDVAIQSDGKIVVAGSMDNDFALVRFNTDGTLDTGFSGDGIVTTDFGDSIDQATSVTVQSDGKIVVAGYKIGGEPYSSVLIARYNSDGSLDSNLSVVPDTIPPTVSIFAPFDGATNVAPNCDIKLTFSEAIQKGTGTIEIHSGSAAGPVIESYNAATSGNLTINGNELTVNPTADLARGMQYVVTFTDGSVKDLAGNNYAGTTAYDFTTDSSIVGGSPESWLYLASWPDLMAAFGADSNAAAWHYNTYGKTEGRGLTFDAWGYLASWADLRGVFGTNLGAAAQHYVEYGRNEGRTLTFDAWSYLASWADLRGAFGTDLGAATRHYVEFGANEGRTMTFDAWNYLASWDDLLNAFSTDLGAATRHYVEHGANEGRTMTFDAEGYLLSYDDLHAAFGTDTHAAILHYVTNGYHEGRHLVSVAGAPVMASFSPVDGAAGVALDSNIVLTFNESIHRGTGSIELHVGSPTGELVESYDVATSTHLTVAGTTLTINPTDDLARGIQYFVTITTGAIKDLSGDSYAGTTSYDFVSDPNLIGTDGMDMLHGGSGNETISALGGSDTLNGGAGADLLIGGEDDDTFVFSSASDIGLSAGSRDVISDFISGQDQIDLSGIDANTNAAGDQPFSGTLLGSSDVFGEAGQLRYDNTEGVLYGNTDNDAEAEFAIQLLGLVTLNTGDLVL
jgi:uncharacterized delta-60 repeat protein